MKKKRLIACLDVVGRMVTKAYQFQDNIEVEEAESAAARLCADQIDEIIFYDITASSERRQIDLETVQAVAKKVTVPLTVGGGLRTIDDLRLTFAAGADKISIDSMAVRNRDLIRQGAQEFSSDRIVLSIQVKEIGKSKQFPSGYQVMIDGARVATILDAREWAEEGVELGAGEICVNSIDRDGTCSGYDLKITKLIADRVPVPVIASGGAGKPEHLVEVFTQTKATGGIISSMLYSPRLEKNYSVHELKEYLSNHKIPIEQLRPSRD